MPKLNEFFFGGKDKIKKASLNTPIQDQLMDLIKQGLTSGEGALGDLFGDFNEESFQKGVAQPNIKNFEENILPMLQEKFISNNQVLGTGFGRAKLKAGTDLQSKLAELMYQAQNQQKQNKLAGVNAVLGKQGVENIYKQGSEGIVPGFVKGVGQGVGQATGAAVAG